MKKVELNIVINVSAEIVLNAFTDFDLLKEWWGVDRALVEKKIGGLYSLAWGISENGFSYLSSGIIDDYIPAAILSIKNFVYFNPEKQILGPMNFTIKVNKTEGKTNLYLFQDGFKDGEDWNWYYNVVKNTMPIMLKILKEYLEQKYSDKVSSTVEKLFDSALPPSINNKIISEEKKLPAKEEKKSPSKKIKRSLSKKESKLKREEKQLLKNVKPLTIKEDILPLKNEIDEKQLQDEIIEIRKAGYEDAEMLTAIAHAAKRYWNYPDEYIHLWKKDLTISPAYIDQNFVYCAAEGKNITGFYALSYNQIDYELEHLWIKPDHIQQGIGSKLFKHAVGIISALGGGLLNIVTDPHAEIFYLKKGAKLVGVKQSKPEGRKLPHLQMYIDK